jgi:hypothetical protein
MTLRGFCPLCNMEVELPHADRCWSLDVADMAQYLTDSQARVNALLESAGSDRRVNFSPQIEIEKRNALALAHLNQITGWC